MKVWDTTFDEHYNSGFFDSIYTCRSSGGQSLYLCHSKWKGDGRTFGDALRVAEIQDGNKLVLGVPIFQEFDSQTDLPISERFVSSLRFGFDLYNDPEPIRKQSILVSSDGKSIWVPDEDGTKRKYQFDGTRFEIRP